MDDGGVRRRNGQIAVRGPEHNAVVQNEARRNTLGITGSWNRKPGDPSLRADSRQPRILYNDLWRCHLLPSRENVDQDINPNRLRKKCWDGAKTRLLPVTCKWRRPRQRWPSHSFRFVCLYVLVCSLGNNCILKFYLLFYINLFIYFSYNQLM